VAFSMAWRGVTLTSTATLARTGAAGMAWHRGGWPGSARRCTGAWAGAGMRCSSWVMRCCAGRAGRTCWQSCRWSRSVAAPAARFRATSKRRAAGSTPVTAEPARTARRAALPVPHPRSSTRSPGRSEARWTTTAAAGASCAAVVSSRPAPQSMAAGGCPLPVMAAPFLSARPCERRRSQRLRSAALGVLGECRFSG
jgi:hypothetical protein